MPAQIIGVDPATDLALLKIDAQQPADDAVGRLVDAEGRRVGAGDRQPVSAESDRHARHRLGGRPHAISASRPTRTSSRPTPRSIPGNSGGALVNARGELVGINTAIFSQSGGYQGIGFAVPSNLARRVVNDLQQFGEVRRGSIGYVEIAPLTTQIAQRARRARTRSGVLITQMRRDSPAYDGGLRPGDVVVTFNGTAVADGGQLSRLIQDARIGSTAAFGVIRDGRRSSSRFPSSDGN